MLNFKIALKPLSVNKAWKGRRYKTKEYDKYIKEAMLLMPNVKVKAFDKISVNIIFGFSNKSADVDNPVKPLLDIITKKYGIDDKHIYRLSQEKVITAKGKEFIEVNIEDYILF